MRSILLGSLLALTTSMVIPAVQAAPYTAGKEYVELAAPVAVSDSSKVEVVELFWYGCPHCYQFEPTLEPWVAQLPEDVSFKRIPAMFGGVWNLHGQVFLTLEQMQVDPSVHKAIFDALHQQGLRLSTIDSMADFLANKGVDKETFLKTYNSFAIKRQVESAKKLAMQYQITGVPVMIVDGKYRFDLGTAGGPEAALQVADFLIEQERSTR